MKEIKIYFKDLVGTKQDEWLKATNGLKGARMFVNNEEPIDIIEVED